MVLGPGIDPGLRAPQTRVLPLHYPSKLVPSVGFEPTLAMILSQRPLPIGLQGHNWCVLLESN